LLALLAGAGLTGALVAGSGRAEQEAVLLLRLDRSSYPPKAPIQVSLEVSNKSQVAIHLSFPTSQRYDLSLEDETGKEIWRWSQGRLFLQMMGEEVLKPSTDGPRFRETIAAPAIPGSYKLSAWISSKDRPLKATISLRVR
jgi:hypothetical protein